jgi:hypothetical protein
MAAWLSSLFIHAREDRGSRMRHSRTRHRREVTAEGVCVVLSLSGEPLGEFGRFSGDRFSLICSGGGTLWVSTSAIYLEHPLYVELVCTEAGLSQYVVGPPLG